MVSGTDGNLKLCEYGRAGIGTLIIGSDAESMGGVVNAKLLENCRARIWAKTGGLTTGDKAGQVSKRGVVILKGLS
jgi:hypothetical protein